MTDTVIIEETADTVVVQEESTSLVEVVTPGPQGAAGTIQISQVNTVAPGTPAAVRNVGTSSAAILQIDIPQGQTGDVTPSLQTLANGATASAQAAAASATTASTKATEAGTSASSAAGSASTASTKATEASASALTATTKAAEASTSATNAAASATSAASSKTAAETSAAEALASKNTAVTNATAAATSAATSSTKAAEAALSATSASGSASTAATQAATATTKAGEASASATAAAASAASVGTAAATATTQATLATTKANEASASATAAAGSATSSGNSATAASESASTASTQAGVATTKATEAAASAATASTKASEASDSATAAVAAKNSAESARDQTLAAFDSFDDRYLGQKSSDPTVDNDGNALVGGALYFNTNPLASGGGMKVYDAANGSWLAAYASLSGALVSANNLSDLASVSAARINLGLGNVENKSAATILSELSSTHVATALGFTPYDASNPSGYITSSALSPYLTSATAALTYQPIGSYLTGITSGQVTTALGFTPANKAGDTFSGAVLTSNAGGFTANSAAKLWTDSSRGRLDLYEGAAQTKSLRVMNANGYGIVGMTSAENLELWTNGTARVTINGSTGVSTFAANVVANSGVDSRFQVQSSGVTQGQFQTTATAVRLASNNTLPLYLSQNGVDVLDVTTTAIVGNRPFRVPTSSSYNSAFVGEQAAGAGRFNLYMSGTAANYLAGALQVDGGITGNLTGNVTGNVSGTAASITGVYGGTLTSGQVTTALGFTPYDSANSAGYITSSALSGYLTSSTAASTYQTLSGMSSYLTTSTAASTYAPISTTVTLTGAQTLTDKTLTSPVLNTATASGLALNDGYTEEVFAVTGTTPALSPNNGSIQTWTLSGNSTPTAGTWAAGQSITLMIDDGTAYTVTWTSLAVTWETGGGTAPTLATTGYTVITLWKVGTTIYGAEVGG